MGGGRLSGGRSHRHRIYRVGLCIEAYEREPDGHDDIPCATDHDPACLDTNGRAPRSGFRAWRYAVPRRGGTCALGKALEPKQLADGATAVGRSDSIRTRRPEARPDLR